MGEPDKLLALGRELLNELADKVELCVPSAEIEIFAFNMNRDEDEPPRPTQLYPYYVAEPGDTPALAIAAAVSTSMPLIVGRTVYWRRQLELRRPEGIDQWVAWARFSVAPPTEKELRALFLQEAMAALPEEEANADPQ